MQKHQKWSKIESIYERLFIQLTTADKEAVNAIPNNFERHYMARTALTVKRMQPHIIQHTLYDDAIDVITGSIIESMPTWCPCFLENFYVVLKKPHKNIKALWGCFESNYLIICGDTVGGRSISSLFFIDFENKKYDFGSIDTLYDGSVETDNTTGFYFVRFLLTLGLLLEAEKTPLLVKTDSRKCSPAIYGNKLTKKHHAVLIKKSFSEKMKEYSTVRVRGFLRNQAYGESWSKHRIVYIAPFERQQKVIKKDSE